MRRATSRALAASKSPVPLDPIQPIADAGERADGDASEGRFEGSSRSILVPCRLLKQPRTCVKVFQHHQDMFAKSRASS